MSKRTNQINQFENFMLQKDIAMKSLDFMDEDESAQQVAKK